MQTQKSQAFAQTGQSKGNPHQTLVKEMTLEEAEQVIADFGQFKGRDITVKELQTIDPKSFEWLLNLPNPRGRMVKLNEAAKLIHNASAAE